LTSNELRKDYLLNRWVIITTERSKRPTDFATKWAERGKGKICPFCPGNEKMTPPATLLYFKADNRIKKGKDTDGKRRSDWLIRVFPNLYPALKPPSKVKVRSSSGQYQRMSAVGLHEVVVESPKHDEHPSVADVEQLKLAIEAIQERVRIISTYSYIKYVSVFRNHGKEAGASLSHAHSQIIATPMVPKLISDELDASDRFHKEKKKCAFCAIIEKEGRSPRLIYKNSHFTAFASWAGIHPFEFWILPHEHQPSILDMTGNDMEALAKTMHSCFSALKKILNDPPYCFTFHMTPTDGKYSFYHWHIEVYPYLSIFAGFEKGTGMYINTTLPEDAAKLLRNSI
jgi:UDPglucose--hexose-1-phosphate uridylyltransferase